MTRGEEQEARVRREIERPFLESVERLVHGTVLLTELFEGKLAIVLPRRTLQELLVVG